MYSSPASSRSLLRFYLGINNHLMILPLTSLSLAPSLFLRHSFDLYRCDIVDDDANRID